MDIFVLILGLLVTAAGVILAWMRRGNSAAGGEPNPGPDPVEAVLDEAGVQAEAELKEIEDEAEAGTTYLADHPDELADTTQQLIDDLRAERADD